MIEIPGTNQKVELKLCQMNWALLQDGDKMTGCDDTPKGQAFQGRKDIDKANCKYSYKTSPKIQGLRQRNTVTGKDDKTTYELSKTYEGFALTWTS